MVTWSGFIGKMIELLVGKVIGKKIDLVLDDRKKAARTFLRLHHLLTELETITKDIHSNIDNPERDYPRMPGAWLHDIDRRTSDLSNDFLRLSDDLKHVLSIFDPALQRALANLEYSKFSLLVCATRSWHSAGEHVAKSMEITYTYPSHELMSIDFESHYRWFLANNEINLDALEWPQSALIGLGGFDMICEDAIPNAPSDKRIAKVKELRRIIEHHTVLLSDANAKLRDFIGKTFKVEDVLS